MIYFQTYDGAYAALACLRSAIREFDYEAQLHDRYEIQYGEKLYRRYSEIVFWIDEFYRRRDLARKARKG